MQSANPTDQPGFPFQTVLLSISRKDVINQIENRVAAVENLADYVAFEGIALANGVVLSGFGFMREGTPVNAFASIKWCPIWSAENIDVGLIAQG
ncbi:hypothetical protein DZD18_09460 [Rhodobacteraceae bacterium W635]|nr:hypothetical protein DZD18_09460 [Rhodobacteraceae bacterium W635]